MTDEEEQVTHSKQLDGEYIKETLYAWLNETKRIQRADMLILTSFLIIPQFGAMLWMLYWGYGAAKRFDSDKMFKDVEITPVQSEEGEE